MLWYDSGHLCQDRRRRRIISFGPLVANWSSIGSPWRTGRELMIHVSFGILSPSVVSSVPLLYVFVFYLVICAQIGCMHGLNAISNCPRIYFTDEDWPSNKEWRCLQTALSFYQRQHVYLCLYGIYKITYYGTTFMRLCNFPSTYLPIVNSLLFSP